MSLTKIQFESLVHQTLKKINACEGISDYLNNNHCFFYLSSNGCIDYQSSPNLSISLDRLEDDGSLIPSDDYPSFIEGLLKDTQKLFLAVKTQRQAYLDYLETIKFL